MSTLGSTLLLAGCAQAPAVTAPASVGEHVTNNAPQAQHRCEKPIYPLDDRLSGHTGTATVGFLIGTDGWPRETKVIKSSGYPNLDNAAAYALQKCHFKPALKDGKPVEAWQPVQYVWQLR